VIVNLVSCHDANAATTVDVPQANGSIL